MPSVDDSGDTSKRRAPSYVVTFDPAAERASDAIVAAIATLVDEDPSALTPLFEVVEPDAIDSLVEHAQRADADEPHELWFGYEGFDVGVRTDGEVRIREATAPVNS